MKLFKYVAVALLIALPASSGQFPFSFFKKSGPTGPQGPDGVLVVTNGQTVTLTAGTAKDYTSINVNSGGILQFGDCTSKQTTWGQIRVRQGLINNGTIRYRCFDNSGVSGTISTTSFINSMPLSWIFTQVAGGVGPCSAGAQSYYGNGTGGGICSIGGSGGSMEPLESRGGHGRRNAGGSSFNTLGASPAPAAPGTAGGNSGCGTEEGSGGGARGYSGGGLYISVDGAVSGSGSFDVSGHNGGKGGDNSCGGQTLNGCGGGAASGQGGRFLLAYGSSTFAGTYLTSAGTAGAGGTCWNGNHGAAGSTASAGDKFLAAQAAVWPTGADGVLHVKNGETVTLSSSTTKDYFSVKVDSGGILQVGNCSGTSAETGVATIGVLGDVVNNGTIKFVCFDQAGIGGLVSESSPGAGTWSLSKTYTQAAGGDGGGAACNNDSFGNGGGGANSSGTCPSASGVHTTSGAGRDGASGSGPGAGAAGVGLFSIGGATGSNGGSVGCTCDPEYCGEPECQTFDNGAPGAGSGGTRGRHGGPMLWVIRGGYSGNGVWNISGTNGGVGGCSGMDLYGSRDGGMGGGGAGGSGGKLDIYLHGSNSFSGTYTETGGSGGTSTGCGSSGASGSNGSAGSHSVTAF